MHPVESLITEARKLAKEAWIFGLPLVEHFKMFSLYRSDFSPVYRDWNKFFHVRNLMRPAARAVVSPNSDTLMSSVLIDLRKEPVAIEIPSLNERYFSLQLIDILTNSFAYAGSRTSGNQATTILLLGPDWNGTIPNELAHAQVMRSPSRLVLGLCRTGAAGRPDTLQARELQNALRITPLPNYLDSKNDLEAETINWPTYFDVKHQDGIEFFNYVNFMLQWHKFTPEQSAYLKRFEMIGIKPGAAFPPPELKENIIQEMEKGIKEAREHIQQLAAHPGEQVNGWIKPHKDLGNFRDNFELRAVTAWSFLYANVLEEATYIRAYEDQDGVELDTTCAKYELTFSREDLPRGKYFWSLTMYDGEEYFLYENKLERYAVGDRSEHLEYDPQGGLTIYLQHETPGEEKEPNWLPAPKGRFYLTLRIYGNQKDMTTIPGLVRYNLAP